MKMKHPKKMFNSILLGNIITILVPVIIVGYLFNTTFYYYFNKEISRRNKIMSVTIAKNMENLLAIPVYELLNISLLVKFSENSNFNTSKINNAINELNYISKYFQNIEILDINGKVRYTLPSQAFNLMMDRSGEAFYEELIKTRNTYWSDPFISKVTGKPTLTIAIIEQSKIIVGYLNLDYIKSISTNFSKEYGEDIEVSLTDSHGVFILNENQTLVDQRRVEPNITEIKKMLKDNSEHLYKNFSNVDMIVTAAEVQTSHWLVIVYEPYKVTFYLVNNMIFILIVMIAFCLFLFTFLSIVRVNKIVRDLEDINNQAKNIANGKLEFVHENQNYEEFNNVASNFNLMVKNIIERDRKLEEIAYHDSLTGLYNRTYLYEKLWKSVINDKIDKICILYFDIDNFKNINDMYGHLFGDEILVEFCQQIQYDIPVEFKFVRIGGDEFIILVPDNEKREKTTEIIMSIENILKTPLHNQNRDLFITMSIGISVYPDDGIDFDTILKCADTAMYAAKADGKNTVRYFKQAMNSVVERRMNIENYLHKALDNNEFHLVYQPQIELQTAKIKGFEALLRWENPVLGNVGPTEFIRIAEEIGLIIKIGEWVIRNASRSIKMINEKYNMNYIMSINASPVELKRSNYALTIEKTLEEESINPEWLEIEITENVFMDYIENITPVFTSLKDMGIRIALDDFGTGYSSLSYINKIPIDTLKIDREFINNITSIFENRNMTSSIIMLGHNIGITIVAEGVEDIRQIEILRELSCDFVQGYYISKPVPYDEIILFIENNIK